MGGDGGPGPRAAGVAGGGHSAFGGVGPTGGSGLRVSTARSHSLTASPAHRFLPFVFVSSRRHAAPPSACPAVARWPPPVAAPLKEKEEEEENAARRRLPARRRLMPRPRPAARPRTCMDGHGESCAFLRRRG